MSKGRKRGKRKPPPTPAEQAEAAKQPGDQPDAVKLGAIEDQLARCGGAADDVRRENDEQGAASFKAMQRLLLERSLHAFQVGDILDGTGRTDMYALAARYMAEAGKMARHGHKDKYAQIEARLDERDARRGAFAEARAGVTH